MINKEKLYEAFGELVYVVAMTESQLDELRTLLSVACIKFQQKCIYLSAAGQVEFIEANQNETS